MAERRCELDPGLVWDELQSGNTTAKYCTDCAPIKSTLTLFPPRTQTETAGASCLHVGEIEYLMYSFAFVARIPLLFIV